MERTYLFTFQKRNIPNRDIGGETLLTRRVLFAALAVVACAVPASATINYYADLPAFMADNVSAQNESFDGITLNSIFPTLSQDGFTFSSTSTRNTNLTVLANPGGSWPTSPTTDVLAQVSSGGFSNGSIVIALPANVFGIAFYTSYVGTQDTLQFTLNAGDSFPSATSGFGPPSTTPFFFGARSDQAITAITISSVANSFGYAIQLGGLQFDTVGGTDTGGGGGGGGGGDPSETPESSSLLLMGAGLMALPLLLRRRLTR